MDEEADKRKLEDRWRRRLRGAGIPPEVGADKQLATPRTHIPGCGRVRSLDAASAPDEVLDALEKDHAFLLKGDVFTPDLIESWIDYKRKNEVDAIRLRPHP